MQQIMNKIRQICEICYEGAQDQIKIPRNYKNISQHSSSQKQKQMPNLIIKQYLTALQYLQQYVHQLKQAKTQYENLQECLQKQQTQIRKHIGIQQQLRLYTQSVKLQLEQCQREKLELLENSKITIKNMKLKNQKLFEQLTEVKRKIDMYQKMNEINQKPSRKTNQSSHIKTKIKEKPLSASGQRKDSSLNKIIKTQYIQRQKHPFLNVSIRKQLKYKNQSQIPDKVLHKYHKSTILNEQPRNSQSKKKHKAEHTQKGKKQKVKSTKNKQFDLGTYLSKNQLKKSPLKNQPKKQQQNKKQPKQQSTKRNEKHHRSSFHEKTQKSSKLETQQKIRQSHKQDHKQQNKQKSKSKSKQSKKRIKSKDQIKLKGKQTKKGNPPQHNRSLFSVSSVQYKTTNRQN